MTNNLSVSHYGDEDWLQRASKILSFDSSVTFVFAIVMFFAIILAAAVGLVAAVNFVLKRTFASKVRTENEMETFLVSRSNDQKASLLQFPVFSSKNPPNYDECMTGYWWDDNYNFEALESPPKFETLEEIHIQQR